MPPFNRSGTLPPFTGTANSRGATAPSLTSMTEVAHHFVYAAKIQSILTRAPGNGASIGSLKVVAERGWFAARASGTEDIYKIDTESFRGTDHLGCVLTEAQTIVGAALAAPTQQTQIASGKN